MATVRNKRIKWTNKYSGESGYVKSIKKAKGYFENTFDINEALKLQSDKAAETQIAVLIEIGEACNNNFEIVTV